MGDAVSTISGCIPEVTPPALTLGLFNHCHFSGDQSWPSVVGTGLLMHPSSSSWFGLYSASLSQKTFSEQLWELPSPNLGVGLRGGL